MKEINKMENKRMKDNQVLNGNQDLTMAVPSIASPRMRKGETVFYLILSVIVALFVLSRAFDYNSTQLNSETAQRRIPHVLATGNHLVWEDLLRSIDAHAIDGRSSARFVARALDVLNIKFRIWLWQFIPPHPSLSLLWIFSLVLCPILLFKLVRNLTSDLSAAWIAVLLYGVSPGLLSGVLMYFHSGKPLTSFFTIFCFYLASKLDLSLRDHERMMPRDTLAFLLLVAVLLIGFFTDELGFFTFAAVPVMFPHIWISIKPGAELARRFRVTAKNWILASLYLIPPVMFFLLVTFAIPCLSEWLGFQPYDFWQSIQDRNAYMPDKPFFASLSLNIHHMLANHIIPFRSLSGATVEQLFNGSPLMTWNIYIYVTYLAYILIATRGIPDARRTVFLRALAMLVLFCVFNTLLFSNEVVAFGGWYYGCTFSVFFVIALAMLLSAGKGLAAISNKVLLVLLLVVFATNSMSLNAALIEHIGQNYRSTPKIYVPDSQIVTYAPDSQIVTYVKVREAWQKRENRAALEAMIPQFPGRAIWLFLELQYLERGETSP